MENNDNFENKIIEISKYMPPKEYDNYFYSLGKEKIFIGPSYLDKYNNPIDIQTFVSGTIGDNFKIKNEKPIEAARREVMEEIGFCPKKIIPIWNNKKIHLFSMF